MSYEGKMLEGLKMPARKDDEQALLKFLFHNNIDKSILSSRGTEVPGSEGKVR
jgi:hypothetical protein